MQPNQAILAATQRLVADCELDTASIFFCDHSTEAGSLSYLHHVAVSEEAQYAYRHHRHFSRDPFVALTRADTTGRGPGFVRWGDRRLEARADASLGYHDFLSQYGVAVVGALGRRISSRVSMIIGTHRRPRDLYRGDVPMALLAQRLGELSELVIDGLFENIFALDSGREILSEDSAPAPLLAERESQIATMISDGLRNKEIAWQLGISEFTVENHLRRIYRKLGIHNRAALVARFSGRRH